MKKNMGLWIDHRKAVIVTISGSGEDLQTVESGAEKHVRSAIGSRHKDSGGPQKSAPEDSIERKFTQQLNTYYKKVIEALKDADSIRILGPGEAKLELKHQIKSKLLLARVAATQAADTLTDSQLKAKVRSFFQPASAAG